MITDCALPRPAPSQALASLSYQRLCGWFRITRFLGIGFANAARVVQAARRHGCILLFRPQDEDALGHGTVLELAAAGEPGRVLEVTVVGDAAEDTLGEIWEIFRDGLGELVCTGVE